MGVMFYFIFASFLLFVGCRECIAVPELDTANKPAPRRIPWRDHLRALGTEFDCYFTVEYDSDRARESPVSGSGTLPNHLRSIEDLVIYLQKEIPNANVFRNKRNSSIIHLRSKSIADVPKYILDDETNVTYRGKLQFLPDEIGKLNDKRIVTRTGIGFSGYIQYDVTSEADIVARKRSVRDILCDYVPLLGYNRIIWMADTSTRGSQPFTQIYYLGPSARDRFANPYSPNQWIVFNHGEDAFTWNPTTAEAIAAALSFIRREMQGKEPRQVRWAMLFLAKAKCERCIPVLLEHLEYKYTDCGLIEESFPAVRALIQLGEPAAKAALEELGKPQNPNRRRLLCHVIRTVKGPSKAQELLQAATKLAMEEVQRKNLEEAVKILDSLGSIQKTPKTEKP